jgi:hypothetical protein
MMANMAGASACDSGLKKRRDVRMDSIGEA